jgi:hypothetical protein
MGFLQIRRMVLGEEPEDVQLGADTLERAICVSSQALGNGTRKGILDLVYVHPHRFRRERSLQVAGEVGTINRRLAEEKRPYILIGPGRWGSADPWLGIPVTWEQISGAVAIVETGLEDVIVSPSQGTHFFQNITALGLGYFTVNPAHPEDWIDWAWLESQPEVSRTEYVRHVRVKKTVRVTLDGQTGIGAILPADLGPAAGSSSP